MSHIERSDGARIHYEVHGTGEPVLLLAPGGVASRIESWVDAPVNPIETLSPNFQVIALDQRHAGQSPAPAEPFDYEQVVADQLAVLDELGVAETNVVAAGAGCLSAWRLAERAPERVRSLVCVHPAGLDETNTLGLFHRDFDEAMRVARADGVAGVIALAEQDGRFDRNPGAGPFAQRLHDDPEFRAELGGLSRERYIVLVGRFRDGLWPPGSPYFTVSEEWVRGCRTPMLVVPGDQPTQPEGVAKRLGRDAPGARVAGLDAIADFLAAEGKR